MKPRYENRSGKWFAFYEGKRFGPFRTEEDACEEIATEFGVHPMTGERFFDMDLDEEDA